MKEQADFTLPNLAKQIGEFVLGLGSGLKTDLKIESSVCTIPWLCDLSRLADSTTSFETSV